MAGILIVDDDLFFSARLESMVGKTRFGATVADTLPKVIEHLESRRPALVIVNFVARKLDTEEIIRRCKAHPDAPPVLAFMPHKLMSELRPLARAAGADLVVANSAIVLRLPMLLDKLLADGNAPVRLLEAQRLAEEGTENRATDSA